MSKYAVIVQNDESKWNDIKGDLYNYPITYKNILTQGCVVIYYKGNTKNSNYLQYRLSPQAHYFGIGVVGESILDPDSLKNDFFAKYWNIENLKKPYLLKKMGYIWKII